MSVEFKPRKLQGPWDGGYALDIHTVSSAFLGYDGAGHAQYHTTYSPVGELLYQLKSGGDPTVVPALVDAIESFWAMMARPAIDFIVPAPFSKPRKHQPVIWVAKALSERMKIPLCTNCISKVKQTEQLKDLFGYNKRMAALEGAFAVATDQTEGKDILLVDDLYRSGATVCAITALLKNEGKARAVRLLTLTKTRKNS
jgi:predicted amidophosphoribosyltransferase